MTASIALAIVCGAGLGLGLWSIVAVIPRIGRARLVDRLAPYLVDTFDEAREMMARRTVHPVPVLAILASPLTGSLGVIASTIFGSATVTEHRLRQSGSPVTVPRFRMQQLAWAGIGVAAGAAIALLLPATSAPVGLRVAVPVIFGLLGAIGRDLVLQRAAKSRLARLSSELPSVVEFLSLSLAAGEGIVDSLRRVSRSSGGVVAAEFAAVISAVGSGVPIITALREMSVAMGHPALTRCVDQITGALERGTPLADVLRAQAADIRGEGKRQLLETASKKEVAMLFPLVFLILPITILFAVFPGVMVLQAGF
ncbi:type II secretion system F family protein [Agromyces atrinae]|uniref:type II secretion system F family protein n=1 Tax=Agromyces atrinae TaxID=592376 RepID=UPI001F5AF1CE|nr:type II secretion system F family protein [Agromyces atrinae]MCI2959120.1 type II secretion system F family protein [Agromyces atrinae]